MQEPYIEGLATHDDPESCVDAREDIVEALTGARAGRVLSPVKTFWERRRVSDSGRQHGQGCMSLTLAGSSGSKTPCMRGTSKCDSRESHGFPIAMARLGRGGNAKATSRRCTARGSLTDRNLGGQ